MTKSTKRPTFILIVAVSLDGKITEKKRKGTEWTSKEDQVFFQKELNHADVVVLGRKTFEAIVRPLTPRNRIIFTRGNVSLPRDTSESKDASTIPFNGTREALLSLLTTHRWNRVVVAGGPSIYGWFFENKMVDEIYLTVEPLVFESGKPFLSEGGYQRNWTLVTAKKLNANGTMLLHYKPNK